MPLSDTATAELPLVEDYEDLYENAPCGYLSLGADGRIVRSNQTLSRWIGYSAQQMQGRHLRELLTVPGAIFYETHFAPLLRMQGFFDEVALDLVTVRGETLAVLTNAVERRDASGALLFTRITILRATERRRYERELVLAREQAEHGLEAERAVAELREQFIAVLGHDLRNPLAGILAGLRRLQTKGMDDRTPEIIALMLHSGDRMNRLINDILDLARSRLGSGIPLRVEQGASVEPTLRLIIDELRTAFPDRVIEDCLELGEPVDCDHERIAQLLSNLLGNALTHGSHSEPVRIEAVSENGKFRLSVINSGKPIPQDALSRLFQPFHRGEETSHRQGLGLGLFIASEIARAHGGALSAESNETGTVFSLHMHSR